VSIGPIGAPDIFCGTIDPRARSGRHGDGALVFPTDDAGDF